MAARHLLYVNLDEIESVAAVLSSWLVAQFTGGPVERTVSPSRPAENFSLNSVPATFGLRAHAGWVQVWADTFFEKELPQQVSRELGCVVVGLLRESTSGYHALWVYRAGTCVRSLESGEDGIRTEGDPLPGEEIDEEFDELFDEDAILTAIALPIDQIQDADGAWLTLRSTAPGAVKPR